jgi:hypothetical protein
MEPGLWKLSEKHRNPWDLLGCGNQEKYGILN